MMTTKGTNKYWHVQMLLLMAVVGAIALSIYLINTNNKHFRASIEEQEQGNLLMIAKGAAFRISEFIERRKDRLLYLSMNEDIKKSLMTGSSADIENATRFISSGLIRDVSAIYLIDKHNTMVSSYKSYEGVFDGVVMQCERDQFAWVEKTESSRPMLLMQKQVIVEDKLVGAIGIIIDLYKFSQGFEETNSIDFDGTLQVIDDSSVAIVFPEVEALGSDVVAYRRATHPEIDWSGYGLAIQRMKQEDAGIGFYDSLRAEDNITRPSKKVAAFARVPSDDLGWSVLAISDYKQILEPIIAGNLYTALLYALVSGLFIASVFGFRLYTKKAEKAQELEAKVAERTSALSLAMESLNSDIHKRMEVEERFRLLFTHSADAILIMDADTGALYGINPVGMNLFRMNQDECSKDELDRILPEPVLGFINRQLGKSGYLEVFDEQLSYMDGDDEVTLLAGAVTRPVAGSRVVYFSFNNITDRIMVEKESAIRLQHLIQADKMTALGTLVSGVAHEINNPNAFIMTNASVLSRVWRDVEQLLDRHKLDGETELGGLPYSEVRSEVPNLLAGMIDGSNRIKRIVASLKDFARKDDSAGKRPLNLNNVITDATVILGNRLKRLNDNFHMSLSEALPQVTGNPQQLEQVVINLIMNSLDALDGGGSIWVETSYDSKARMVKLVVSDDGAGMSEEAIRRAPEPFYTTKQSSGGTGLGLYISFNILREHGAELSFSSALGSGTTATVLMPAG